MQLESQYCGCPGHEQCCYRTPTDAETLPNDIGARTLIQLVLDVYSHLVYTSDVVKKINHLNVPIPSELL